LFDEPRNAFGMLAFVIGVGAHQISDRQDAHTLVMQLSLRHRVFVK
jgi:hypothetical protein